MEKIIILCILKGVISFKMHKIIFFSRKKKCVPTLPKIFRPVPRNTRIIIFLPDLLSYPSFCFRTCLRYFLPPAWVMDKDSISGMSPQELATFPLDDFFDHYEKGLRKVIVSLYTLVSLFLVYTYKPCVLFMGHILTVQGHLIRISTVCLQNNLLKFE